MATINLPRPEYGKNDKETIQILMDTVVKLRKELEFALYHLDETNTPGLKSIVSDVSGNTTSILQNENSISLLAQDVVGNSSAILQNANSISLAVDDIAGNSSSISLLSDQMTLKVGNDEVVSAINLSPESISISADKINLDGVVTMSSLAKVSDTLVIGSGMDTYNNLIFDNSGGDSRITCIGSSHLEFTSDHFIFNGSYISTPSLLVSGDSEFSGAINAIEGNLNLGGLVSGSEVPGKINFGYTGYIYKNSPGGESGDVIWAKSEHGTSLHVRKNDRWYAVALYEVNET